MEEVRLLANIESDTDKLLPVVLVGQPELADRLNERALRQLKQRVALRCRINPLDLHQTAAYIAHRLTLAGGDPASVFSRESVIAIYERSRGIPRLINVICDNALLSGFALDRRLIGSDLIAEVGDHHNIFHPAAEMVGDDFDLTPELASPAGHTVEPLAAPFHGAREGGDEDDAADAAASGNAPARPLRWREPERRLP